MFAWWPSRRKARDIPDDLWQGLLATHAFIARRPPAEVGLLRERVGHFLADKQFHGAHGLAITDAMALSIAAQACLPVLHLGLRWYDDFVGIVVHPGEVVADRTVTDDSGVVHQYEELLAGEAMDGGPVMLSWSDVEAGSAGAHDGTYNVVIHEFVHKIDMRDGVADGCPPLPSAKARRAWLAVMQAEYDAFREQVIVAERFGGPTPWLDPYGAQSIDEFFAVACEAYFVDPERFAREHAALAGLFAPFFEGDPAPA
jgi:Mlc titration factor MtfA (ptsG expression regulator)